MNIPGLLFLILIQFLAGRGILGILQIKLKPILLFAIGELLVLVVISLIPMFVELFFLPLSQTTILSAICLVCGIIFIIPHQRYDFTILKAGNTKMQFPTL